MHRLAALAFCFTIVACGEVPRAPAPATKPSDGRDAGKAEHDVPERRVPEPAQHPAVKIPTDAVACANNVDCTVVPTGDVCEGWTYSATSPEQGDAHRQAWAQAASQCGHDGLAALTIPEEYEGRCWQGTCFVARLEAMACSGGDLRAGQLAHLEADGALIFHTERPGRYRLRVSGSSEARTIAVRGSDCESTVLSLVSCREPSAVCWGDVRYDGGERHILEVSGCTGGCEVTVEHDPKHEFPGLNR